jgi:hypothetical protein
MDPMTRRLRVIVAVALVAAGCAGVVAAQTDVTVGRIVDMEPFHGYVVVEFANGRMNVAMDKREMGRYIIGDEIYIDSFGRPVAPPAGAQRRPAAPR